MIIFATPTYEGIARDITADGSCGLGVAYVRQFPNQEWTVSLAGSVCDQECAVVGSMAPPDSEILTTLLLCHTLKKERAKRITAVFPYLGYMRQDKDEPANSLGAAWLGELLGPCGVNDVIAVDVHSQRAGYLFFPPMRSISPSPLFAAVLSQLPPKDITVVAPDEGAVARAEALRRAAGICRPLAFYHKRREGLEVHHLELSGEVGRRVVVVDDILDTGATLVSCCRRLRQAGVEEIIVMATHGLFTGDKWQELWSLGVTDIYCTDSVPQATAHAGPKIHILSVAPLLRGVCTATRHNNHRIAVGHLALS